MSIRAQIYFKNLQIVKKTYNFNNNKQNFVLVPGIRLLYKLAISEKEVIKRK